MKDLMLISKKVLEEKKKYFENIEFYANKIKQIAVELLGTARVLVFGSVVKKNYTPLSDIDILIISENLSTNWQENRHIRTEIKKRIGSFSPFQLHLVRPEEFECWYKRFIKEEYIEV
ncbi:MAG: nucleotidyltransferase domain-containing protein [Endomicrobia bacterium]|nr:nucleotidyltransferase domain-containing protein [Endomicrobiia bacterium]MCX7940166.1 nucleotidyltransferase domain-containing protein [Endomicrobiia bacterium]MDW8055686.1 nucleotidyltransferase domain-containing protein [Elusimicrobiota bacterium]